MNFNNFTILLFIILFMLLNFKKLKTELFTIQKPRIAVYSYNFGNYRSELKGIDNFKKDDKLDYYFYTNNDIKSKKWNVIKVPLQPRTDHMNANRVTTKYYKFKIIPPELKKYDYLLHIDSSRIKNNWLDKLNYKKLSELIKNNNKYSFLARKHPQRKTIYEEVDIVLKYGLEKKIVCNLWSKKLKKDNYKQKIPLTELCLFIRDLNNKKLTNILEEVYDIIMDNKICRDQLVFSYILEKNYFYGIKLLNELSIK